jgi:hypothetical protein
VNSAGNGPSSHGDWRFPARSLRHQRWNARAGIGWVEGSWDEIPREWSAAANSNHKVAHSLELQENNSRNCPHPPLEGQVHQHRSFRSSDGSQQSLVAGFMKQTNIYIIYIYINYTYIYIYVICRSSSQMS